MTKSGNVIVVTGTKCDLNSFLNVILSHEIFFHCP